MIDVMNTPTVSILKATTRVNVSSATTATERTAKVSYHTACEQSSRGIPGGGACAVGVSQAPLSNDSSMSPEKQLEGKKLQGKYEAKKEEFFYQFQGTHPPLKLER